MLAAVVSPLAIREGVYDAGVLYDSVAVVTIDGAPRGARRTEGEEGVSGAATLSSRPASNDI